MGLGTILADAWNGIRRNLSMALAVVLVTLVSMYLLGLGLLAQRQADQMKGYWYDRVQVSIYLCTDTSAQPNCDGGAVTDTQKSTIESQLDDLRPLVQNVYLSRSRRRTTGSGSSSRTARSRRTCASVTSRSPTGCNCPTPVATTSSSPRSRARPAWPASRTRRRSSTGSSR